MSKNESTTTGIFAAIALAMAIAALIIAWPSAPSETEGVNIGIQPGSPLFPKFVDPLKAANLLITTFDDEVGKPTRFEVRRDSETGVWTIPSRGGYPADAVVQMRNAANALVDLKVLDSPTTFAEDHRGFGVIEPIEGKVGIGDEGIGRLVVFKDEDGQDLGSLIIGKPVEDQPGQVYVRIPGQDPVYTVGLDDRPLTTRFQDWIEEDLLQLSSIDVEKISINEYSAALNLVQQGNTNQVMVQTRPSYDAQLELVGTQWRLNELKDYDATSPNAPPSAVELKADQTLNTSLVDRLISALDDLKFVDVARKPEGISANLRADASFANNNQANAELAKLGFYPYRLGQDGQLEIRSANGELRATTKQGVQYILRFGQFSGLSESDDASAAEDVEVEAKAKPAGGLNRYLLVTTRVNMDRFPPPDLRVPPETLEDLEAMDAAQNPPANVEDGPAAESDSVPEKEAMPVNSDASPTDNKNATNKEDSSEIESEEPTDTSESNGDEEVEMKEAAERSDDADDASQDESEDVDKKEADAKESKSGQPSTEASEPTESDASSEASENAGDTSPSEEEGEVSDDASGEGSAIGEGQDGPESASDESASEQTGEDQPDGEEADDTGTDAEATKSQTESDGVAEDANESAADRDDAQSNGGQSDSDAKIAETEDEKKERLATIQEKIIKDNERKIDARNEAIAEARRISRALNERFADWYYVIPETTYSKLKINRGELINGEQQRPNPSGPAFNFRPPNAISAPNNGK